MMFSFVACRNTQETSVSSTEGSSQIQKEGTAQSVDTGETSDAESTSDESSGEQTGTNSLVAYFAYSENMGDTNGMSVDVITSASVGNTDNTEGNLQVMAQTIQEKKSANIHKILVENPYDTDYDVMRDRALEEQDNDLLPALKNTVENLEQYDVIYLGTPVWSGSLPQPMVTFMTENDLSGKIIVPFGIHLGSRFGSIISQIEELCPDATLVEGFTLNATTPNDKVQAEFGEWLDALELN